MKFINTKAVQIPVSTIISILTAISDRDYARFQQLQTNLVKQHGVEVWQDVFGSRVLPALDQQSNRWLLKLWCKG
ncbi:hypothetical protein H6G33_11895 [Calothrix sp. FACHB-1219]|uniref:hypothetical protein n=1 Tax=unclassified Calothrix TaxID=2619626 RepID=UPI001687040C|nr:MULTISPECIES: hypothetical protein [unclassified Calothrix]MBD2202327.1 hypothetical protein [Calothrix sp. FACHB-168]MBD2217733.1 hypothetical protein [Calothrix sp. FACHB-1219]